MRDANEGWLTLDWEVVGRERPQNAVFEVQQSLDASFSDPVLRYRGPDGATFLSGLPEGDFYYRVRLVRDKSVGPWSAPLDVRVTYVDRGLVWLLMTAGLIAFLATSGALLLGHRGVPAERLES